MKIIFTLLIALMLVSMINCHKSEPPSGPDNNNIDTTKTVQLLPLKIGNEWIYKIQYGDTASISYFDTLFVESDTMIWGQRFFITRSKGYHTTWSIFVFPLTNMKDGLYYYFVGRHLYIKYPTHAGDTLNASSYGTAYIKSVNETVDVPAGLFTDCLEYIEDGYTRGSYPHWISHDYFKPDIGLVKYEHYIEQNYKLIRTSCIELLKYKLY